VLRRYGRPLETDLPGSEGVLELGGGRLRRVRYHAPVDAMGRDWLLWEATGEETLAVLSTTVAAALRFLVMRLQEERGQ
jgi:hypothetical protein